MRNINNELVSVGIPTFNRPNQLLRALNSVINQQYKNIEIIISDNSPNTGSYEKIITQLQKNSNIKYYKQNKNIGSINNFKFVLEKSTGKYFMWVADDDILEPYFINECLDKLSDIGESCASVTMEAQYFSESEIFGFFEEGDCFYDITINKKFDRVIHIATNSHGNLWYSLFRKNALIDKGKTVFDHINLNSFNEIPLLMYVAAHGSMHVMPKIGLYKKTKLKTYMQARWEKKGGDIPNHLDILKNRLAIKKYHIDAIKDISTTISNLNVPKEKQIKKIASKNIILHYKKMINSASHCRQKTKIFLGMPVYNGGKYIEKALTSIIAQTYPNWKLLISDNNSTDETFEICTKYTNYDNRIIYVKQNKNIGAVGNFQFTLKASDSPYFKWTAHDDIIDPFFLEKCMLELKNDNELKMIFTNFVNIDSFERIIRDYPDFQSIIGKSITDTVINFLFSPEILGKANLIYSIFNTEFCKKIWEISPLSDTWGADMAFVLCALSRGKANIINDTLFKKRLCRPSDRVEHFEKIIIKEATDYIFPANQYNEYTNSLIKATLHTPYQKITNLIMKKRLFNLLNKNNSRN